MKTKLPPKLRKFPASKQRRLDHLLNKNSEGTITAGEVAVLKRLVAEAEELMVANAKRLAEFSKDKNGRRSEVAVPVTVWVQPHAHRTEQ